MLNKLKQAIFLLPVFCLVTACSSQPKTNIPQPETLEIQTLSFEKAIAESAREIAREVKDDQTIVIVNFDTSKVISGDKLSSYVIPRLRAYLVRLNKNVIDRDTKNEEILKLLRDYDTSGAVREDLAISLANQLGAGIAITGLLTKPGQNYQMMFQALDTNTRKYISSPVYDIKESDTMLKRVAAQEKKNAASTARYYAFRDLKSFWEDHDAQMPQSMGLGVGFGSPAYLNAGINATFSAIPYTFFEAGFFAGFLSEKENYMELYPFINFNLFFAGEEGDGFHLGGGAGYQVGRSGYAKDEGDWEKYPLERFENLLFNAVIGYEIHLDEVFCLDPTIRARFSMSGFKDAGVFLTFHWVDRF